MPGDPMSETAVPLPPQNLLAEEYVLGALMLTGAPTDAVFEILDARDFYGVGHAAMYRAARDLHAAGEPIDALTLTARLEQQGKLGDIATATLDGRARIRELATIVPAATNAPHHAQLVVDAARRRDLDTIGSRITRLAHDPTEIGSLLATAAELAASIGDPRAAGKITLESWAEFEAKAREPMTMLIDKLWPEAAFGFIAGPPKKGKTWIAITAAIALATGRPFLGFTVPDPVPVVYVALEGHRAAIRGRIGCLTRGFDLDPDPDTGHLNNLHLIYKPRGINLADPAWAHEIRRTTDRVKARIVFVDVLRAGARIKEGDQAEFGALRANLQPITDNGTAIAMLHHFTKLSDTMKEREAGERMSGSGAMFGALDVGLYITGSEDGARKLRIEIDTRDLATPDHINVLLEGKGTGDNGGFIYHDTARYQATATEVNEDDLKAPPLEIAEYVDQEGGDVLAKYVRAHFDISDRTLTARRQRLAELGIDFVSSPGLPGRLVRRPDPLETSAQLDLGVAETSDATSDVRSAEDFGGSDTSEVKPHNKAKTEQPPNTPELSGVRRSESGDMQGKQPPLTSDSPTEREPTTSELSENGDRAHHDEPEDAGPPDHDHPIQSAELTLGDDETERLLALNPDTEETADFGVTPL